MCNPRKRGEREVAGKFGQISSTSEHACRTRTGAEQEEQRRAIEEQMLFICSCLCVVGEEDGRRTAALVRRDCR